MVKLRALIRQMALAKKKKVIHCHEDPISGNLVIQQTSQTRFQGAAITLEVEE